MRRFATTYRWELFLLFGLPVVLGLLGMATFEGLPKNAIWADCGRVSCAWWISLRHALMVHLVLLGATYPFVRRQGREFLTLLWGLETALQVVRTRCVLAQRSPPGAGDSPRGFRLIDVPIQITRSDGPNIELRNPVVYIVQRCLRSPLPVYLWFIRRASRISMGHAFLLYGLSMADAAFSVIHSVMIYVTLYPTLPYIGTRGLSSPGAGRAERADVPGSHPAR